MTTPIRGRSAKISRLSPTELPGEIARARSSSDDPLTVIVTDARRARSDADYALVFLSNLLAVLVENRELTMTDFRVYLAYATTAEYGNAIVRITALAIAERIGTTRATVSRSRARLQAAGLMYKSGGIEYLNTTILLRGRLSHLRDKYYEQHLESVRLSRELHGDRVVPPLAIADSLVDVE